MVGEVFLTTPQVARYYGTPAYPELHLSFNFPPLFAPWEAGAWRRCIHEILDLLAPGGSRPTWVLSNHDQPRQRSRYGSEAVARAAAVLLLSLPGTPFLYAGEEFGLEDAVVPADRLVDPGGRDGCRAPIPWAPGPGHGWVGGERAWLPWPPEADAGRTAAELRADRTSILHLYRDLLTARRLSSALVTGELRWYDSDDDVLCFERVAGVDRRVVAINFSASLRPLRLPPGSWIVEVASDGTPSAGAAVGAGEGAANAVILAAHQAVLFRPA